MSSIHKFSCPIQKIEGSAADDAPNRAWMRQTNEGQAIAKVQSKHDLYAAMRTATKSMGSDGRHFNSDEEEGGDGGAVTKDMTVASIVLPLVVSCVKTIGMWMGRKERAMLLTTLVPLLALAASRGITGDPRCPTRSTTSPRYPTWMTRIKFSVPSWLPTRTMCQPLSSSDRWQTVRQRCWHIPWKSTQRSGLVIRCG